MTKFLLHFFEAWAVILACFGTGAGVLALTLKGVALIEDSFGKAAGAIFAGVVVSGVLALVTAAACIR